MMGTANRNIDAFIIDLLRIDDIRNRLVDLDGDGSFRLSGEELSLRIIKIIQKRFGKPGNTLLRGSAVSGGEQALGLDANVFDWQDAFGKRDPASLDKFIKNAYGEIDYKGINPLFLSVGAIRWKTTLGGNIREVLTPLLLFPVRLVRSVSTSPVAIEFVDDDVYLNPCLLAKIKQTLGDEILEHFPHPDGESAEKDEPVDLKKFGSGEAYFQAVLEYSERLTASDENALFRFERDLVAVSRFNHDEICMYYDIRRNREKIDSHPLIARIFGENVPLEKEERKTEPRFVLKKDSVQEEIIRTAVNGESLIVKGPPGTGKTLTIAGIVSALLSEGKKVLVTSEKLSALSEVYAKLPDKLRTFSMLLDCETASQASRLNPSDVKRDLQSIVNAEAGGTESYSDFDRAMSEMYAAQKEISAYVKTVFGESVAGGSYYDALDRLCKNDLPVLSFADKNDALSLTREAYETLLFKTKEAGEYFDLITDNGAHLAEKCPWFPIYGSLLGKDAETAFRRYSKLVPLAERAVSEAEKLASPFGADISKMSAEAWLLLTESGLSEEEIKRGLALSGEQAAELEKAYSELSAGRANLKKYEPFDGAEALFEQAKTCLSDESLTLSEIKILYQYRELLSRYGGGKELFALVTEYQGKLREAEGFLKNSYSVFRNTLTYDERAIIESACPVLAGYKNAEKPKTFDFSAKRVTKKLKTLSYLSDVKFSELCAAVSDFGEYLAKSREADGCVSALNRLFRTELSEKETEAVKVFARLLQREGADKDRLLNDACHDAPVLGNISRQVRRRGGEGTLQELRAVLNTRRAEERLLSLLESAGISLEHYEAKARGVVALRALSSDTALLTAVSGADGAKLKELFEGFRSVSRECFPVYYGEARGRVTFGDLKIFISQAADRNIAGAAAGFFRITEAENALPLDRFFRPFVQGAKVRGRASFADWFEHSVFSLAVAAEQAKLGERRNGMGKRVTRALERFASAEEKAAEANVSIIRRRCLSAVKAGGDYAFLEAERSGADVLRRLFKKHGEEILKLKRCFLMSPSTVSVLFRGEAFDDFDAVIVDEASQLEPTGILPVLLRAKQCILVGDEWQMPPIRHFVTRNERRITDGEGEETLVDPDESVLGLALAHEAFPVLRLNCHYRSKTEPLIAFSQKRYYPGMQTLPAPVPIAEGLGFTDVYLPEGYSENAVNEREAEEAVARLNRHFDTYYDEKKGVLNASFGVIAFGEKQLGRIKELVAEDKALTKKLKTALAHFNDVPEKLAFFRTIESAQGRETEHVILSLTYGKRRDGTIVQSFGEMNRGKIGQCIFNVAVTRAKSSVTVIHSVRAEEIVNENVRYLREYLEYAARFSEAGKAQFVSVQPAKGFLRSVGEYIISCGVSAERVVYNYGVSESSVKIPVAVLSENLDRAVLGVWCETPLSDNYFDRNLRRYRSLTERGWNLIRIYAHDWTDNARAEREALYAALKKSGAIK